MKSKLTLLALAAVLSTSAQANLVGHWTFDEGAGLTANDSSASNFDATLAGNAAWSASGKFGGALDLTAGGFATAGNVLDLTGSFTVSAWVNTTSTQGMTPVASHDQGFANGYFLAISNVGDGAGGSTGQAHFYQKSTFSSLSTASVADGQWHLLTGVYDASVNTVGLYVDGISMGNHYSTTPVANVAPFIIGGFNAWINGSYGPRAPRNVYSGLIDDVRVYDTALTGAQVTALTNPVPEPETFALMLAGLGIMGAVARRRKARSAV